jgi:hypothetical protein
MKTETTFSESVLAIILVLITSPLLSLYQIAVLKDIVSWYKIPLFLTTPQIFGIFIILSLIKYSPDSKSSNNDKSIWGMYFTHTLSSLFFITVTWGLAYLYKSFI